MAEQRLPDGFRHLPTVPRTGRATELLPRILLTKCPDTLRKSHSKRKQHLVSQPCSKGLSAQKVSKASFRNGKHPNFGRFLVQEDHLAKLQFPKTVLAPGGDTGQHDVGMALKALEEKSLVTEEKDVLASLNSFWEDSSLDLDPTTSFRNEGIETSQELYPSVCRSWAAQQAYCRSLMSSRNESRMNTPNTRPITSRSDTMVTELCPQHRREALQHSFSIFPEEVAARLKDMRRRPVGDYHIDLPDSLADESGSSAPQSQVTSQFQLQIGNLPVVVLAAGHGGIAELQEHVESSSVQWALLQFCVGEGTLRRQRLLFLHINGKDCPPIPRGRANELTASVQRALREGSGGTAEAFHASVEVKGSEEVTVENLLQRVLPFFVVDKEEYSVQWLQSHYDRQLRDAEKSEPKVVHVHHEPPPATQGEGAAASAKRGTIFELGNTTFSTGRDALKAVAEPLGPWNWAFFTGGTELTVVAGGIGSVEEMRTCYEEHPEDVLFGLLRLGFGEGRLRRTKYVFIHAIGDRVPAVTRGRLSAQRPQMEEIMGNSAQHVLGMILNQMLD
eukprot:symbB.v1.2.038241.t1/scaffold5835.1/size23238/2